mgnify:CR=1 FL=1|tara:strand:- start:1604 stop:2464 length:861 start_codon:yes stop_codon:yes gene_type:complete
MSIKLLKRGKQLTDQKAEKLKTKFLTNENFDILIDYDCDVIDNYGNPLLRFRKNVIPKNILELGYNSFKKSIVKNVGRGVAAGGYDTSGKFDISPEVTSGNVGYMDARPGNLDYCRLTSFGREYFNEFQSGIPFVEYIDYLYSKLCPKHYLKQKTIADSTNRNFVISNTSFTTVTVNQNFQTAVHKDAGDYKDGFGNLIVYNNGSYDGGFFVLPQYKIAVDVQSTDALFVDVHQWHGNTEMKLRKGFDDIFRISFVLYYRENMFKCKQPSEQLKDIKIKRNGYFRL